ncbi:MAG: Ig domain-containing protein [Lachnospiraceae bacterium]
MNQLKKGMRMFLLMLMAVSLCLGISMKAEAAKVSSVKFSKSSYTMSQGSKKTLTVSISPSSEKKRKVNFKSSNSSIVSVKRKANNKVEITAKKTGTATITATVSGTKIRKTCKIQVKKAKVATKKVAISQSSAVIYTGYTKTLKASVSPSNATYKKVTWSSSNTKIATVSSSGKVTAKKAGKVTITAQVKEANKKATCKITVKNPTISLSPTSKTLYVGDDSTLKAKVTPSSRKVIWSSSNTKIATISSSGKVTAKKAGTVTITAKIKDTSIKKTCKVTVKNVEAKKVTLSETAVTIYVGQGRTLTANVSPSNATKKDVIWTSSDTAVAAVSTVGKIVGKKEGTATITVKVSGTNIIDTCKVTVKNRAATQAEIANKFYHTWKSSQYSAQIENRITKTHMFINNESTGSEYKITKSLVNLDGSIWIYATIQDPTQYGLFKISANGTTMKVSYSHDNGKTYSNPEYNFTKIK